LNKSEHDLIVFDYRFLQRPSSPHELGNDFWGGYSIEFKLISAAEYSRLGGDLERIRRSAISTRPNHSPRVEIQISKYEYIGDRVELELDEYTIYMYSPQMIVFEKLRAICQQLPDYIKIMPSHSPRPRARDFYDIHLICEQFPIVIDSEAGQNLLNLIFNAKKVPLSFIKDIGGHAAIHRQDWQNVLDTLPAAEKVHVKEFDSYLSFVLDKFKLITYR
jgi:hypothetical protein